MGISPQTGESNHIEMLHLTWNGIPAKTLQIASILLGLSLIIPSIVFAVEVPPSNVLTYIQTNGPSALITLGDWYTSNSNGTATGYHYFAFSIPCGWPSATPVQIDLFSPEMNSNSPLSDEINGAANNTVYELYGPGTTVGPAPNIPGPNAAGHIVTKTYTPASTPETWVRFYTIPAPVQCGRYVLRSETQGDDQNGWKLRIGSDNDTNPANTPPANYDNPDGLPGTNDEIIIGMTQTSFQHDQSVAAQQCFTLYQYVRPGQGSVAFHNFDMDGNQRVRYYAPSAALDPLAQSGGIVGTVSANGVWNGGSQTSRGAGDVINNPEPGWWRIVTCMGNHNQVIQEGITGVPAYYAQPPTPVMAISISDGKTTVVNGTVVDYTIPFTNTSNATTVPGAATNLVLTDTLPPNLTYQACGIVTPLTGTCTLVGNQVVFTLTSTVNAGASGTVTVRAQISNSAPVGPITNPVSLSFQDSYSNVFAPVTASDTDQVNSPTPVTLSHFTANSIGANWGVVETAGSLLFVLGAAGLGFSRIKMRREATC